MDNVRFRNVIHYKLKSGIPQNQTTMFCWKYDGTQKKQPLQNNISTIIEKFGKA